MAWGTGWPLPDDVYAECDYWGSCVDGAGYVWHYFAEARFLERNSWTNVEWNELSSAQNYPEHLRGYSLNEYSPYSAQTITISGDCINSAQCDGESWTLASIPTEITFTADNTKINIDALVTKIQECVTTSNTATNRAYQ